MDMDNKNNSEETDVNQKVDKRKTMSHLFKPGQSGNPKGRGKGNRSKFAERFFVDFMNDWEAHGIEAIAKAREEEPATYLRIAASLIPKELTIREGDSELERLLEQFNNDELNKFITGIAAIGAAKQGTAYNDQALIGAKPDGFH